MTKQRLLLFATIFLAVLNIFLLVFGFGFKHFRGRPETLIFSRLEFSHEQREKFRPLTDAHVRRMSKIDSSVQKLKSETMVKLLKSSAIDSVALNEFLNEMSVLQQKKQVEIFDHFLQIRALCDERQKGLYNQFIDEIVISLSPKPPHKR